MLMSPDFLIHTVIYLHLTAFTAIIITLAVCTKNKNTAEFVFTHFENNTGWESDELAFLIGLLPALFAFFSIDSAAHFSEEIPNQTLAVPRIMVWQALLNSFITIPFIITTLFCMGDPNEILNSKIGTTSPFSQIIYNSTGSAAASVILNSVNTWTALVCGLDLWGAAARIIFSLARDNSLPARFGKIHSKLNVPLDAILVLIPLAMIICLIYIWNSTAFYGIMSCVLAVFQISYGIPIMLKVFRFREFREMEKGPWNMKYFGLAVDAVGLCFSWFITITMCLPTLHPVTAANMNYTILIIGIVFILTTILWFSYAKARRGDLVVEGLEVSGAINRKTDSAGTGKRGSMDVDKAR
ncbi:hypothetical protein N7494_000396 [Penicillium frequentans]|uniref:Choline transport protein n=1 Tax=Penicillium frequentans TaxID=3151616 RepID=A0AAD6D630_9EURO|nr:hypothetical protein N7494_000396 [Penicillium glabrum]